MYSTISFLLLFFTLFKDNSAINLFPEYAEIFTNTDFKYFGYSVKLVASAENNGRLIVSAPKFNSIYHPNLNTPGAVFSCEFSPKNCKQFIFNLEENVKNANSLKDHSFFGASFDMESTKKNLVACAPLWGIKSNIIPGVQGICYFLDNMENINETAKNFAVFEDMTDFTKEGNYNSIFGEVGFSSHFLQGTSNILIGAPGVFDFTGVVMEVNTANNEIIIPSAKRQDLSRDSYLGYTITSGKLDKSGKTYYLSGAPRANNMIGKVHIFHNLRSHESFENKYVLTGETLGEYFGSAITVVDTNGDGINDIIVGAPMYFIDDLEDIGRIYIFTNTYNDNTVNKLSFARNKIDGVQQGARFGMAISSLGDIDKDGFEDIAVGAPYYNENRGAIFIYLGSKTGLSSNRVQLILGSEINHELRGFGYSISRGIDIDNNNYNDLAVGSYLSGHAVVIKSRPIAIIYLSLRPDPNNKVITIDTKSMKIKCCLRYNGTSVPETLNIMVSVKSKTTAVSFGTNEEWTSKIEYNHNEERCDDVHFTVSTAENIEFTMQFEDINNIQEATFCSTCPITDGRTKNSAILRIPYANGCADNNNCRPDLQISSHFNYDHPVLVIGKEEKIEVSITISNSGENAFLPKLNVTLPTAIDLTINPNECGKQLNKMLICNFGDVIAKNHMKSLTLSLDITKLRDENKLYLEMMVSSSGNDVNLDNNKFFIELPLRVVANISLIGNSNPEEIILNNDSEQFVIEHKYDVKNIGPSPLYLNIIFFIQYVYNDEKLLEVKVPEYCSIIDDIHITGYQSIFNDDKNISRENICQNLANCVKVQCKTFMTKSQSMINSLNLTMNTSLLDKILQERDLIIYSTAQVLSWVLDKPHFKRVQTIIKKPPVPAKLGIYITIGVLIGVAGLAAVIFILYKLHFFERKKFNPEQDAENKLLNETKSKEDDEKVPPMENKSEEKEDEGLLEINPK